MKRYLQEKGGKDYKENAKARNQGAQEVRNETAKQSKANPKSFSRQCNSDSEVPIS